MQAKTLETLRSEADAAHSRASSLRADAQRYATLQLEAEQALERLKLEPFEPRYEEAEAEQALRLRAFQAGRADCKRLAQEAEEEAERLEAEISARSLQEAQEREQFYKRSLSRIVRAFEVEELGVEHSQYFQGASAEDYEEVFVGIGRSAREALQDALESCATAGWKFEADSGFPSEPDAQDYSEEDAVSAAEVEAERDSIGTKPEPRYRVALYPHNGSGPVILREGLSLSEAANWGQDYATQAERKGLEVSDLIPETCDLTGVALARWELQFPESGVSDAEGILSVGLEPESAQALESFERASERYSEEPADLSFRVALRVSDAPESEGERFGLSEYEDCEGVSWLFAPNCEEAERAAMEAARENLWAFSLDFLSTYFAPELREPAALKALERAQRDLSEGFQALALALLGSRVEQALSDAVHIDGMAHFLATFDGNEVRDSDGALRFRI